MEKILSFFLYIFLAFLPNFLAFLVYFFCPWRVTQSLHASGPDSPSNPINRRPFWDSPDFLFNALPIYIPLLELKREKSKHCFLQHIQLEGSYRRYMSDCVKAFITQCQKKRDTICGIQKSQEKQCSFPHGGRILSCKMWGCEWLILLLSQNKWGESKSL